MRYNTFLIINPSFPLSFTFFFPTLRRVIKLYCLQFVVFNSAYYEDTLGNTLPPYPDFVEGIRRAPDRGYTLTPAQTITALKKRFALYSYRVARTIGS